MPNLNHPVGQLLVGTRFFLFFFISSVALLMTNRFGIIAEYYSHLVKAVGPQTKHIICFVIHVAPVAKHVTLSELFNSAVFTQHTFLAFPLFSCMCQFNLKEKKLMLRRLSTVLKIICMPDNIHRLSKQHLIHRKNIIIHYYYYIINC